MGVDIVMLQKVDQCQYQYITEITAFPLKEYSVSMTLASVLNIVVKGQESFDRQRQ